MKVRVSIATGLFLFNIGVQAQTCNPAITLSTPNSRYSIQANGFEVKDNKTDLIWQRCSLGQTWDESTCSGSAKTYIWGTALNTAKSYGEQWRIPNVKELQSLVEEACYNPAINQALFPNTPVSIVANTMTASPTSYGAVWVVNFGNGVPFTATNSGMLYIRLVRSGQ